MKKQKIKLCVLDMAGTLVRDNNDVQKIFIQSFKEFGLKVYPQAVNAVMGYEKKYAIQNLLETTYSPIRLKIKAIDVYRVFNKSMIEFYREHAEPVSYAGTALKKIKSYDIKIALNTGFGKQIMNTIITTLKWNDLIDDCISSDQVPAGRPHPFMIQILKKRTKVFRNDQVAKIGDTPSDLMEGAQAKCALNIGIYSKNFPPDVMASYPHTHLVPNIRKATAILLDYNASL